ncbi:nuclear transport factor 2 family protein [Chitinophagaceae bacterium LB-8]|uniref:Nuclear transport factor 2 family protein n=1 Tax=Paraflavisolibacter caeni TaxID=2982496 RepID=A0A9X2XTX3_9BACT|nr:nuclear transport factor 2 family protein [Paraflavisolibacter caeni]MCU7548341.1 nuclear transport factor 2 family protein [Paraflavisolibacter caeni]
MKYITLFALLAIIISCTQRNKQQQSEISHQDTVAALPEIKEYDYPVRLKHWQIGNHENIRTVLKMYKAWDEKSISEMKSLIADSMTYDMPDGRRGKADRDAMIDRLLKKRAGLQFASNDVIAAFPLKNLDENEEWVMALVYNKWAYKDRIRDSMLYQDIWKIKDGKISYLLSLEQSPSRVGAKTLEKMINR